MGTIVPAMTFNAAGDLRTGSLGAGANATVTVDVSAKILMQVLIKSTAGGTVAATSGLLVEVYPRYGTGPTTAADPMQSWTVTSTTSTAHTLVLFLEPGKWAIKVTNLDASNALTDVEITSATIDNYTTT